MNSPIELMVRDVVGGRCDPPESWHDVVESVVEQVHLRLERGVPTEEYGRDQTLRTSWSPVISKVEIISGESVPATAESFFEFSPRLRSQGRISATTRQIDLPAPEWEF